MSALVANGYHATPHHRQNRRRERPGSRSRKSVPRKSLLTESCLIQDTGLDQDYDARDAGPDLHSVKATPSPLLRHSFDQSWLRWKAREAELKAQAELERALRDDTTQLELEQQRLFGGDVGDDELYALGILYDDDDVDAEGVSVIEEPPPAFVIRPGRPRRSHRSAWEKLPLDTPFHDDTIASHAPQPLSFENLPIQHRSSTNSIHDATSPTPRPSLPSIATSISALESIPELPDSHHAGDWTFVHAADASQQQQQQHAPASSTPASEPETWILLGDDSQQTPSPAEVPLCQPLAR